MLPQTLVLPRPSSVIWVWNGKFINYANVQIYFQINILFIDNEFETLCIATPSMEQGQDHREDGLMRFKRILT
jgi:hypothetical protein